MKDEFVMVPRELVARIARSGCWPNDADELRQVLAEQHQDEPVAWINPHWDGKSARFIFGSKLIDEPCPELWKPLYTHADPGEVERLRNNHRLHAARLIDERGRLRAQLDVCRAELLDIRQSCELSQKRDARIDAALSASAERNQCDGCQAGIPLVNGVHRMGKPGGYADTMSCQAWKYTNAEPTAPVERAAFEKEFPVPGGVRFLEADNFYVDERSDYEGGGSYQPAWEAWQARAALERKL